MRVERALPVSLFLLPIRPPGGMIPDPDAPGLGEKLPE
jgi:hypothetical protein